MSKFLVIDLDKTSFIEDSRAIHKISQELKLNPLIEISKSGNGIHIWFFFDTLVRAYDVRKLGDILITKAMDIASGIDMNSYDRLFPTQDFVAPDALGNLVALPLHFTSRQENKTVFIDMETLNPFDDQWQTLRTVQKITAKQLSIVIENHIIVNPNRDETLMPWEIKEVKPILFPKRLKAILFEALYIEKLKLSKALLIQLQKFASFSNPEFYIRQNLRKSTYNTPRVISLYEQNERYIILPEVKAKKRQIHQLQKVKTSFDTFQNSFAEILNEIMEDEDRNRLIIEEITKLKDRKVLVLSERIEHLNMLYHYLDGKRISSLLLHGGLSQKVQKEALKDAVNHSIILSTSSYVGEGLDFPHLDAIVFTMPISYVGRMVQYLGRVGRRGQECLAIDFVDTNVAMLKGSFAKRLKGYKEMGYRVRYENRLF